MMRGESSKQSSLDRVAQVSKIALAIGLTIGAVTTAHADDAWGNQCRTWWFSCRTGTCDVTDGGYGCCNNIEDCQCISLSQPQPCPC